MAVLKYKDENGNWVPLDYTVLAQIIDNLNSDSEIDALSAKQGKVLNEAITNILSKVNGVTINTSNVNLLTTTRYILPFTLGSAITLGNITLPIYSKGMVITANGSSDASLIVIDSEGNVYTLFRNGSNWICGKMISSSNNVATLMLASRKTISCTTEWTGYEIPLDTFSTNASALFSKDGNGIKVNRNATLLVSCGLSLINNIKSGAELDVSVYGKNASLISRQLGSGTQTLANYSISPIKKNISAGDTISLSLSAGRAQDFVILEGNSTYLTVEEV